VLLRTRQGQFWARLTIKEKSVEKKFDDFSSERSQQQAKEEEDEEEEVGSGKGACTFEVPENDDYWISYQITISLFLLFFKIGFSILYLF
jgi:hypothetical protein